MSIQNLSAGPELDALVAQKVMGWKVSQDGHAWMTADNRWMAHRESGAWMDPGDEVWSPSSDISDAWEVWLAASDDLWLMSNLKRDGQVTIEHFPKGYTGPLTLGAGDWRIQGVGPLMICRAALKAVGS